MKSLPLLAIAALGFLCLPAQADTALDALVDEMNRSKHDLQLAPHPLPYFVSYTIKEENETEISSSFGSPGVTQHRHNRILIPSVRIGSYDLDSSLPMTERRQFVAECPLDDDYLAIRRQLWRASDYCYKNVIRDYEWKRAYLTAKKVADRLPDMTQESPTTAIENVQPAHIDEKQWTKTVEQLAEIFSHYPSIQKSKVTFTDRAITRWFVNSEGSKVKDGKNKFSIILWASTQAEDGMPISDYEVVAATAESQLPDFDKLKQTVDAFAKRVVAVQSAPKATEYCGPVLFEGQGAAEFFSQVLAPNFGFAEQYLPSEDWRNPLANAVGRKLLPTYLSVVDDPTAKEYNGTPLIGGYVYDDEGVPAQKVNIIENGVLKAFCQSRLPTAHSNKSNGHAVGAHGVSNLLVVKNDKPSNKEQMAATLSDLAKDAGLDYVIVISKMEDAIRNYEYPYAGMRTRSYSTPSYSIQPSEPVVAYKMYLADGHRELVRGLEFRYVSLRAFRDIQAAGDDSAPYIVEPNDGTMRHVVVPSYVVGELELTPIKAEHESPPLLPSPLAEAR